jgi:hypothetical protein
MTSQKCSREGCKAWAISGGTVCIKHGGAAPRTKAKAAVRAELASWRLGDAVDDPGEVLLRLVTQSRVRADNLAQAIEDKVAKGREEFGDDFNLENILIGEQWVSNEQGSYKAGEYVRGLVALESQERDRLANFATKAIAAGLGERQVRIAERAGEQLAVMMRLMADQLGFTPEQRQRMPEVIRLAVNA